MKTDEILQNLRPVEALYLMSRHGEEDWDTENYLMATLVYLAVNGYIKNQNKEIILTDLGQRTLNMDDKRLRVYELEILEAIRDEDEAGVVDAIELYDFDIDFLGRGLLKKERAYFLGFFSYQRKVNSEGSVYQVGDYVKLRRELGSSLEAKQKINEQLVPVIFAFPSLTFSHEFEERIKDIIDEAEWSSTLQTLVTASFASTIIVSHH